MKTARLTVVPTYDLEQFAQEATMQTLVPPSNQHPTWTWLNETSVPAWKVLPHQIPAGELDHRMVFLLLHVDGVSTLADIVKTSEIGREEALGILADLMVRGYISLPDQEGEGGESGIRELAPAATMTTVRILPPARMPNEPIDEPHTEGGDEP